MGRATRLIMTITVLCAGAFSAGHYVGGAGMASAAAECKAAVVAALDDRMGAVGAYERFEEQVGRCL